MNKRVFVPLMAALCMGSMSAVSAAEITAAVGATGQSDLTYRLGVGFDWNANWLSTSVGHVTGYWDAGYTYWDGNNHDQSGHSLSFAPVFVYEFNGDYIKPFIEIGVGVSAFSDTHIGRKDLGGAFNFEDRLGAGIKFGGNQKVGIRVIHYSNLDISPPNDGIESYSLFYSHSI